MHASSVSFCPIPIYLSSFIICHLTCVPLSVSRYIAKMPTWMATSHAQVQPIICMSNLLSVTLPPSPVPIPHNPVKTSKAPWIIGTADLASPPHHRTVSLLLILSLPIAGLGILIIPVSMLPHQKGSVAPPHWPSVHWTFTLLTTMLPLPLQLCLHCGRAAWWLQPAFTWMDPTTIFYQIGTITRLRLQSTCPHATAEYLRIV